MAITTAKGRIAAGSAHTGKIPRMSTPAGTKVGGIIRKSTGKAIAVHVKVVMTMDGVMVEVKENVTTMDMVAAKVNVMTTVTETDTVTEDIDRTIR
jgi:hypothetical protein